MHDTISGWRAPPDGVLQVAPNAGQDDLEHGQAAAESLLGQQVTFPSDGNLLGQEGHVSIASKSDIPSAPLPLALATSRTCLPRTGTLPRAGH